MALTLEMTDQEASILPEFEYHRISVFSQFQKARIEHLKKMTQVEMAVQLELELFLISCNQPNKCDNVLEYKNRK